jgi:hypothetical protein
LQTPIKISTTLPQQAGEFAHEGDGDTVRGTVAKVHRLILDHGKDAALRFDVGRTVVEAAVGYMSSEDTDIGYLFKLPCPTDGCLTMKPSKSPPIG